MKNCTELEVLALDYLDGTLGGAERAALDAHLAACAGCAARLREFSASFGEVRQLMEAWPSMQPSRDFDRRVLEQAAAESARPAGLWSGMLAPFFSSLLRPAFAGTLSAVLLAAFAVVRFFPATSGDLAQLNDPYTSGVDSGDEVALVQDLSDLDDMDLLSNFEVLQEMKGATP
jgi:anti-sigma factor RsiW